MNLERLKNLRERHKPDSDVYVAVCPECGAMVAASAATPDNKDLSKDVSRWIKAGYRVELTSSSHVRRAFSVCTCSGDPRYVVSQDQLRLPGM